MPYYSRRTLALIVTMMVDHRCTHSSQCHQRPNRRNQGNSRRGELGASPIVLVRP